MSSKPAPTESLVSGHGNATVTSMTECPKHIVNRDVKCPESTGKKTKGRGAGPAQQAQPRPLPLQHGSLSCSQKVGRDTRAPDPSTAREKKRKDKTCILQKCQLCFNLFLLSPPVCLKGAGLSAALPSPPQHSPTFPAACRAGEVGSCLALGSDEYRGDSKRRRSGVTTSL